MLYQQIARNKRQTIVVMISFLILLAMIGSALGYLFFNGIVGGIIIALIVGAVYMLIMLSQSTDIVMSLNHAQEIKEEDNPKLWHIIEDMALVAKIPMPRVFIINDPSPNAFATGPNPKNSAVAITTGLLNRLNREEIEGVMGHEISHIRNYDIRLQTTAVALGAAISVMANMGNNALWWGQSRRERRENDGFGALQMGLAIVTIVLVPLLATIAQMALSRNREYLADASAVELTRNPKGLIDALEKISSSQPMENADTGSASLYFSDPLKKGFMGSLFDTHPKTSKRIERLRKM